jgi:hypothetical protein
MMSVKLIVIDTHKLKLYNDFCTQTEVLEKHIAL